MPAPPSQELAAQAEKPTEAERSTEAAVPGEAEWSTEPAVPAAPSGYLAALSLKLHCMFLSVLVF